jgi:hypothetical protein
MMVYLDPTHGEHRWPFPYNLILNKTVSVGGIEVFHVSAEMIAGKEVGNSNWTRGPIGHRGAILGRREYATQAVTPVCMFW